MSIRPECWKEDLLKEIERLKVKGLTVRSINNYIRGNKAFLNWCREEGVITEPVKIRFLKEEQKIINILSADAVKAIVRHKPKEGERRIHTLICTLIDTGLRIKECLALRPDDIDLDNFTIRVKGKGSKHRLVPFSQELRKLLWQHQRKNDKPFVFATRNGTPLTSRNVHRDLNLFAKSLGIKGVRFSAHTFRHSFSVNWLRTGGDIYMLSRILGHSSISTTTLYLKSLGIEDIVRVHRSQLSH